MHMWHYATWTWSSKTDLISSVQVWHHDLHLIRSDNIIHTLTFHHQIPTMICHPNMMRKPKWFPKSIREKPIKCRPALFWADMLHTTKWVQRKTPGNPLYLFSHNALVNLRLSHWFWLCSRLSRVSQLYTASKPFPVTISYIHGCALDRTDTVSALDSWNNLPAPKVR